MDLGLKGRTAVVTGASRGIGRACAQMLAAEGARLLLFSRSPAPLDETAEELRRDFGADVRAVAGDMTEDADIARLAREVEAFCGAPDILVLNTGRPPLDLKEVLEERDHERWHQAYKTQLWGGILVLSTIAPMMVQRRYGRIVAITSASVKQPFPRTALSTVFRVGLTGYLKHLATEIAPHGVTVNAVSPASIATGSFLGSFDAAERVRIIPVGRMGTPRDCASAVVFLASDLAGFITGVTLPVDGGTIASLT